MAELTSNLEQATNEKNELLANAEATQKRANLANRLLNGLGGEGVRWQNEVEQLDTKMRLLIGDVMLSSSFVAYIAPFSRQFRDTLVNERWTPDVIARQIPLTEGFDPMNLLTDASKTAGWRAEGLPADPLSTQNASIIVKCARFPLVIDPQLQAVVWIRGREDPNGLISVVPGAKGWLDKVIRALEEGLPLLLENMKESIEAILDNVIARAFVKKGTKLQVALGDRMTDVAVKRDEEGNPSQEPLFRIYMQSRLPNPHYIPEVQAQTTLVNFTVTEKGLEDQLLSTVVRHERNDLLIEQTELVQMQNGFTIKLKELGDNLLFLLATAEGDILANEELIVTLEETKLTVTEINEKQKVASAKEIEIGKAFESYRPERQSRLARVFPDEPAQHCVLHVPIFPGGLQRHLLEVSRKDGGVRKPWRTHCCAYRVDHLHALPVRFVRPLRAPSPDVLDSARHQDWVAAGDHEAVRA